jgi:hypothetical protein
MSIKVNYNFKSIEVKDAIIRVDRLWGSSKEGWTASVRVYTKVTKEVPAIEAVEAHTIDVLQQIEEFNHSCQFSVDERGYESMYKSLQDKFGGVQC